MKYIGIKTVDAVPMTAEEAVNHGYRIGDNNGDGYEVTYEEGYKSWCPKEVFEKHNHEIKNAELAATAELMVSSDYKQRFKAEFIQLKNRYEGLQNMIRKWDNDELNFTPTCPREIYDVQLAAMQRYLGVLEERAEMENIKIYDDETAN